jgi:hypothetical protein
MSQPTAMKLFLPKDTDKPEEQKGQRKWGFNYFISKRWQYILL